MQARASQVELPSVAALFADISSSGPERQRRWSPRTPGTPKARPEGLNSKHQSCQKLVFSRSVINGQRYKATS